MPARENLTGQRFNRLVAIEYVPVPEKQGTFWRCKCDCGNEKIIRSSVLKNGKTKSCGCLQKERVSQTSIKDISNQRFGKLIAIERLDKKKSGVYLWKCLCDCGNYTEVSTSALTSGNTKSCGCNRSIGLIEYNKKQSQEAKISNGTKFGKLTVIEDLGMRQQVEGHNRRWYKCQCDCGEIKEVMGNLLKQGQTQSCGKCISSLGEHQISLLLDNNNIFYQQDIVLPELYQETGRRLRFDFIIYNDDLITPLRMIEFDGRQHTKGPEAIWSKSDSLEIIQERDKIKNNFCLTHNYPLVRIPYTKINQITLDDLLGDQYLIKGDDVGDTN